MKQDEIYVGSRYVPVFADPIEWSNDRTYEPLTIVTYNYDTYTSRQYVPLGIGIDNNEFWAKSGNTSIVLFDVQEATTNANDAANRASSEADRASGAAATAKDAAAIAEQTLSYYTDGYWEKMSVGLADAVISNDSKLVQFTQRMSDHDGMVRVNSLRGNTVRWNQLVQTPNSSTFNGVTRTKNNDNSLTINGTARRNAFIPLMNPTQCYNAHKYLYMITGFPAGLTFTTYGVCISPTTGFEMPPLNLYNVSNGSYFAFMTASQDVATGIPLTLHVANNVTVDFTIFSNIFDLTQIFGAGNEPATVEEFERMFPDAYYPYDAGSLLSVNVEGVRAVGFNQFDESLVGTAFGSYRKFPSMEYGKDHVLYMALTDKNASVNVSDISIGFVASDATLPISSNDYRWVVREGVMQNFHKNISLGNNALLDSLLVFPKTEEAWEKVKSRWNICINVDNPQLNGTYEPYHESTREIPESTYFPDGMRRVGTAYDEIDFVSHKAITRIGSRAYASGDESDTSVITDGTTTFYALTTPTETTLFENLQTTYPVEIGGTEQIVIPTGEQSAPLTMTIVYAYNVYSINDKALSVIAPIENGNVTNNYNIGDYVISNGILYKVIAPIVIGETITNLNATVTTVMDEIKALEI